MPNNDIIVGAVHTIHARLSHEIQVDPNLTVQSSHKLVVVDK